jgi:hypothetical protein
MRYNFSRCSKINFKTRTSALLFYDYILTFGWEVSRYWGSPLTFPTVLFYLNRYGTTLGNIPVIFEYFWTTRSMSAKEAVSVISDYL